MKTEVTVTGKTYDEALTKALLELETTSDRLEVSVVEQGSSGLLGFIGSKPWKLHAVIKTAEQQEEKLPDQTETCAEVCEEAAPTEPVPVTPVIENKPAKQQGVEEKVPQTTNKTLEAAKPEKKMQDASIETSLENGKKAGIDFLKELFETLKLEAEIDTQIRAQEKTVIFHVKGENLGALIGKRGQTLDALQYLVSHVVNKKQEPFLRVKLDIGSYREKQENKLRAFARNAARRVKQSGKPYTLDPMTPNERRIIHAALQRDRYVTTHSEGEGEQRHVVITLQKDGDRQKKEGSIK